MSVRRPPAGSGWAPTTAEFGASYSESYGGSHGGTYHGTHWRSSAYKVYTYPIFNSLPNGTYCLKIWVKGTGGQIAAPAESRDFGGPSRQSYIGNVPSGTEITIDNIAVIAGKCTIGFWSDSSVNQWIYFDDVDFFKKNDPPSSGTWHS